MDIDQLGKIPHPAEETLERYAMKACASREVEALEEHFLFCEPCRGRLERAEEWVTLMKVALPMGPRRMPAPVWRRPMALFDMTPKHIALAVCGLAMLCTPLLLLNRPNVFDSGPDPQIITLTATRGGTDEALATASADSRLALQVSPADLTGPAEIVVVDTNGAQVYALTVHSAAQPIPLPGKLKAGTYWVRL